MVPMRHALAISSICIFTQCRKALGQLRVIGFPLPLEGSMAMEDNQCALEQLDKAVFYRNMRGGGCTQQSVESFFILVQQYEPPSPSYQ